MINSVEEANARYDKQKAEKEARKKKVVEANTNKLNNIAANSPQSRLSEDKKNILSAVTQNTQLSRKNAMLNNMKDVYQSTDRTSRYQTGDMHENVTEPFKPMSDNEYKMFLLNAERNRLQKEYAKNPYTIEYDEKSGRNVQKPTQAAYRLKELDREIKEEQNRQSEEWLRMLQNSSDYKNKQAQNNNLFKNIGLALASGGRSVGKGLLGTAGSLQEGVVNKANNDAYDFKKHIKNDIAVLEDIQNKKPELMADIERYFAFTNNNEKGKNTLKDAQRAIMEGKLRAELGNAAFSHIYDMAAYRNPMFYLKDENTLSAQKGGYANIAIEKSGLAEKDREYQENKIYAPKAQQTFMNAAESVPLTAAAMAGSIIHPALGTGIMGAASYGNSYAEAQQREYNPSKSATIGVAKALIEAGTEALPLAELSGAITNLAELGIKGAAKNIARTMGSQLVEENIGEQLSLLGEKAVDQTAYGDGGWDTYLDEALNTFTATSLSTLFFTGATLSASSALGSVNKGLQSRLAENVKAVEQKTESGELDESNIKDDLNYKEVVKDTVKAITELNENGKLGEVGTEIPSVSGAEDGAVQNTNDMARIVEEYKNSTDSDLIDFISMARKNPNGSRMKYELSDVSERLANDIKAKTNIDVVGFSNTMKSNTITHIDKRHGVNGVADQSMADINDIARMQYVIDNYDNIELLDEKSREYKDNKGKYSPLIRLSKRVNGNYYVVEAVPDTKRRELAVVSAYKNKAVEQQVADVPSPILNVRNAPTDTAFDNNISQSEKNVKSRKKLYDVYRRMKDRCYNSNADDYKYYGAKGVKIHKGWLDNFQNFYDWAIENGYNEGLTIDRIDPTGSYEPNNCRWVSMAVQNQNKRNTSNINDENSEMRTKIEKAAVGSQVPNADNSPQPTSETPLVSSSASTNNIQQDKENVNNVETANIINKQTASVSENDNTESVATPNNDTVKNDDLPEAYSRDKDGKIRFNQIDIDYNNATMRKGQFKTLKGAHIHSKAIDRNGWICGKYGVWKNSDNKYVVTLLQAGVEVLNFEKLSEAQQAMMYLDKNLPFNNVSFKRGVSEGSVYLEITDETGEYMNVLKQIRSEKPYLDKVVTEIQDGKVPFNTKTGLVEYVKSHIGDKVRVTFNSGNSEIRTLESVSNANLKTKRADGSSSTAELKGIKYNDKGFSIDYNTGVSVAYDFVNVDDVDVENAETISDLSTDDNKSQSEEVVKNDTYNDTYNDTENDNTSKEKSMYEILEELGLTYDEQRAILNYKSSESYVLNEALRKGKELTDAQAKFLADLESAMDKFPQYNGVVYRNIGFNTNEQLSEFMKDYSVGKLISIKGFISASKSETGYELHDGVPYKVHYEIEIKNGFDVANIGLTEEQEILLKHNTEFVVSDITYNGSEVFIKMKGAENDAQSGTQNSNTIYRTEDGVARKGQKDEFVGGDERHTEPMDSVQRGIQEDNSVFDTKSDSDRGRDIMSDVRDSISVREGDRDKSRTQGVSEQQRERVHNQVLTDKCELVKTKHTQTGDDLWVVTLKDRISNDEFKDLCAKVKKVGGYYSRYTKTVEGKTIPGFAFVSEPTAEKIKVFNDFFGYEDEVMSNNANIDETLNNQTESDIIEDNIDEGGATNGERKETVYLRSADSGGSDNDTGREGKAVRTGKEIFRETSQEEIKRTDFVRHKGDKNTEIVFSQILPDDHTEEMISLAKKNSEINLETVFTDGKIELYDKNGNLIRIIEDGCYNKANRTIYINCQSKEKLENINEHEKVHAFKRINPTAYEDLLADVGDCVYTEKFMSEIDGYVKPYESAYNKKADFEEIIEEILANLSYEIYSDNIPDYVADVNAVQKAYETFWKSAKIERRNLDNVHDGVLDRESENDSTVRKPEPISQVEEERDTGAENGELGENVIAEDGTDVQDTQREKTATKSDDTGSGDNGIRKSDNGDGDSGSGAYGNDTYNDEINDDVQSTKESKAKDYAITKAVAEELDTKTPNMEDNIAAIETLHKLENGNKAPTKAQQSILAKFKGWGGLTNAFYGSAKAKLQEIMSEDEIKAAQSTVNDAYFTPTSIIDSVYKALNHLGFEGGNILEPSMGVGNFFGRMPKAVKDNSTLFGVEIDSISGRIAQKLYPSANIEIAPFQDVAYKDGAFDLIVGNVPFGEVKYKYKGKKYLIHDYFFVKAMDKLNDGGILAFLTTKGTLDKLDSTTRAELNNQGRIIGAYRLPSNVFTRSAGANVVTDLIIMQKTSNANGENFVNLGSVKVGNETFSINEYFEKHPENIIGELTTRRDWRSGKTELDVSATGDVAEQLVKAIKKLPKNLLNGVQTVGNVNVIESTTPMQTFTSTEDGEIEYIDAATGEVKQIKGKSAKVAKEYVGLKNIYQELIDATLGEHETNVVEDKRKALNTAYDKFVKEHGTLEKNKKVLSADNDFYKISGLEVYDTKTKKIVKSEMFTKDTLGRKKPKKADNVLDALSISIGETGGVDLNRIAGLTGIQIDEVIKQLDDRIVYTPDGNYELNEVYLSGNVREKYEAVKGKKGFEKNEQMLKAVIPEDIPAKNITPQFGAPWIKADYVADFLKETLHLYNKPIVSYDATTGTWAISGNTWGDSTLMTNKYGTKYMDAVKIAEKALNMRRIVVTDKDKKVIVGETRAAQQKAEDIKAAFEEWCFKDAERRKDLVATFNEKFNSNRNMDFSELAKYLTFDGLSDTFKLRDYQKRAVARAVFNGNTLLAHGVGTGKTAEMIAIAMELKRMGIAKKNMMVVPPHKVADFRNDILKMYPSAKVAMLEKGANATQRQKFYALVASNDFDIVIIPHSSFGMLDVSADTKKAFINNQIAELEEVLTAAQAERGKIDGRFIKSLENQKKRLEEKLKFVTETAKDNGNTFEELGVDSLFVDEAHNFKNLPFYSKLSRVAGVSVNQSSNKTRASRAENMFMITDFLNRNDGRITFGTATPITNSMSEIYNMMRFLRPDILADSGLQSFDAWASMFGSIVNQAEVDPSGRNMRMKERFSKFKNVSQMIEQFRRMADILKTGDVIQELPEVERIDVINESNDIQEEFLDIIDEMIDDIRTSGQRAEHNMLEVTTAGQMAAVDLRFVASYFGGKYTIDDLNLSNNRTTQVATRVHKEYVNSNATKGTQFVFCDVGVSEDPSKKYNFYVYGDLINKLVALGIPREEIAIAQDFEDKADLSAKVNTGEIRVLIGSTAVMGEGMNAQNKAVALHHVTVPARPSDIEQREGRIIRYGNENKNVRIYRYIQEKSYDSYQWQMQERKANFINQALSGGTVEELEEMSDFQLSAREAKAIASGNPLLLEKIEVEDKLSNLKSIRNKFNTDKLEMQDRLANLPNKIAQKEKVIADTTADTKTIAENTTKDFEITLGKMKCTERAKAAEALKRGLEKAPRNGSRIKIGVYRGLELYYTSSFDKGTYFILKGSGEYSTLGGDSALGNITRIVNLADKIGESLEVDKALVENYKAEIETLKKEVDVEFPRAKELEELQAKLNDIDTELGINVSTVDMSEVIVADDVEDERYSIESEDTEYERGSSILFGDGEWSDNASAGEQAEKISAFKQAIKGRSQAERKAFAKELFAKKGTEEKIDGTHKYNLVKPEAYNDDMLSMVQEAEKRGKEIGFFIGRAIRKFDGAREFLIDGIKISDTKILVRYDGNYSPQTLLKHEDIHSDWNSPEIQELKDIILGDISESEKQRLLSDGRYKDYMDLYGNDEDAVWEEFIADIFSGMSEYTSDFIDVVAEFWYDSKTIDRYNPAEYNKIIDAGGEYKYTFAGEKALNANKSLLQKAKNMLKDGESRETVLKETGWFKGTDGKWRFEIDDSKSIFRFENIEQGALLKDVFYNEELYAAYPFLKNINVKLVNFGGDGKSLGNYNKRTNTISLSDNMDMQSNKHKGTLIHEIQHAIQANEGFEIGGNPKEMIGYIRKEARSYLVAVDDEKLKEITANGTLQELENYVDDYIKTAFKAKSVEEAAEKAYTALYGEKEAEAAAKRLKLNFNERIEKYPDYEKGAILRNGIKMGNINDRIFETQRKTSRRKTVNVLRSDTGRGVGEKDGTAETSGSNGVYSDDGRARKGNGELRSSGVSQGVKYVLSTDGDNTEFDDYETLDILEMWERAIEEYGAIPKGENPAREIDVPKKISDKKYVSRFARTMLEAGVTPDDAVSEFEQAILDGKMTHEVITNKKAENDAVKRIKRDGFEEALRDWQALSREGQLSKEHFVLGMTLYNQCITNKDTYNAMKLAAELSAEATRAGQTLQAVRMLKLMTPDGQLYYLEKSIEKISEEFKRKLGDKFKGIVLDEKLLREFLEEKDEKKRNILYDKLCQSIADQIPATKLDKWNAWRYLAMLGNPRTHIRNIVGNGAYWLTNGLKNYVGATIETVARVDTDKRTRSYKKSKAAVEFAKKDFLEMQKVLQGENAKYAITNDIESKRTIFKTKVLENLRLKNFDFLEMEDMWFLKAHYVSALAHLITVRKIDPSSITSETLDTLRAFAVKEAQSATYRDANALADGLNRIQRGLERSDNRWVRGTSFMIEGVMPFKKTPLNIAKQGVNYSPVGIMKATYKGLKRFKGGKATVNEVIDDLAKGLTGTGIILLGLWLASIGALEGEDDKPEKEKKFDKMVGEQSYALRIGENSYTIDWLSPLNLSLFVGAKLHSLTKDGFSFADVTGALATISEPLLELSVFSGINSLVESAQYSDSEAVFAIISDMATSYLLQALPTVGGQLNRMLDENKREYYYTDKNSDIPKGIQRFIGRASSKVPFVSFLYQPSVDEWGREETYGNIFERALENTISPGYYSKENYTAVDRELKELYERTGESSVLPVAQQKFYKEKGITYNMSAKQYTEAKRTRGQLSFEKVKKLIESPRYKRMTDEYKVKAIENCYKEAGNETKAKMLDKVKRNSK